MIPIPQALREYVFTGCESSIAFSQMLSGLAARDWIVVTGQEPADIWQALVGTGVTLVLAAQKST
jgi:MinD-like ATPase involved in chromosome partitioning or flagellar assembly